MRALTSLASILRCALLLTGWLGGVHSRAQAPAPPATAVTAAGEPEALKFLRRDLLARVLADSRALSTQYAAALGKLEASLAASGDYEDAISARDTRQAIESIYRSATLTAQAVPGTIQLPLEQARLTGAAALEDGSISGWRTAKSAAEWTLSRIPAGKYQVEIAYVLADLPAGPSASTPSRFDAVTEADFNLVDASILASSTNISTIHLKKSELAGQEETAQGGTITVSRASITLRLEPEEAYPANVIRIRAVRLVPSVPDAPAPLAPAPTVAGAAPESDIATLRRAFLQSLSAARDPVIKAYAAKLATLAVATSDPDSLGDVKSEQRRVVRLQEGIERSGEWRLASQGAGGMDGFEDIVGARFVDDPANTADRFLVEHEGTRFPVRLAWVRCPPASGQDPAALQRAAASFGIAIEDMLAIGRVALEFTRGHLEGRSLRLLVKPAAAGDSAAPALVFVGESGLLQGELIDLGLATVTPPVGSGKRSVTEMALIKSLADREKHVREAAPPAGIWGLRDPLKPPAGK